MPMKDIKEDLGNGERLAIFIDNNNIIIIIK